MQRRPGRSPAGTSPRWSPRGFDIHRGFAPKVSPQPRQTEPAKDEGHQADGREQGGKEPARRRKIGQPSVGLRWRAAHARRRDAVALYFAAAAAGFAGFGFAAGFFDATFDCRARGTGCGARSFTPAG